MMSNFTSDREIPKTRKMLITSMIVISLCFLTMLENKALADGVYQLVPTIHLDNKLENLKAVLEKRWDTFIKESLDSESGEKLIEMIESELMWIDFVRQDYSGQLINSDVNVDLYDYSAQLKMLPKNFDNPSECRLSYAEISLYSGRSELNDRLLQLISILDKYCI